MDEKTDDIEDDVVWKKRDSFKLKTYRKEIRNNKVSNLEMTTIDTTSTAETIDINADRCVEGIRVV